MSGIIGQAGYNGYSNITFAHEVPEYCKTGTIRVYADMPRNQLAQRKIEQTGAALLSESADELKVLNESLGKKGLKAFIRIGEGVNYLQVQKNKNIGFYAWEHSFEQFLEGKQKGLEFAKNWTKILLHPFQALRGFAEVKKGQSLTAQVEKAVESLKTTPIEFLMKTVKTAAKK